SPLAPLKTQVDAPDLTYEAQVALVHQLKSYLTQPEYASDARSLLMRLSDHQSLLASVLKDIQSVLSAEPPVVNPSVEVKKELPPDWLLPGEDIKKEMLVSLLTGAWTGKRLYITNRRVLLTPGVLAVLNRETIEFPLQEIVEIKKTLTRLMPTVEIRLKSGHQYTLMLDLGMGMPVGNRDELIQLLNTLKQG
ncbi:MAG: hypothetical protein K8I82_08625, partial [Anaerolineae bacterium]|nr:hypothetical protein [Anaerolineae bacterium]